MIEMTLEIEGTLEIEIDIEVIDQETDKNTEEVPET